MIDSDTPPPSPTGSPGGPGPALLLEIIRHMEDAARARVDGVPSYGIMAWLVGLSRRAAFVNPETGRAPAPESLGLALERLQMEAGDGPIGDLLTGALRSFPLGPEDAEASTGFARLFLTALVLLLDPASPRPAEVATLLRGFEGADSGIDRRGPDGLGLRFLRLSTCLALGIRAGVPVAMQARQLHDLGTLAGRGAGALLLALDAAEQQEDRLRAALNDPAFAMRVHARVPSRAMAADDAETVRKDFNRQNPLAEQARDWLAQASAAVGAMRADIAALQALERGLQEQAGLVLMAPR